MAEEVTLKALHREVIGKSVRRLRKNGLIPAVLYGEGKSGIPLQLEERDLKDMLKGHAAENFILRLDLEGVQDRKAATAMIRAVQIDPLRDNIIHVDFQEVSLKKKIRIHVRVEAVGEPIGVREQGGVLDHPLREIEVETLPTQIPEEITCDVSGLKIGDSLSVKDLLIPEGLSLLTPKDATVFTVSAPKAEEEVKPEEEVKEPELIRKVKEEKGEAEAPETQPKGKQEAQPKGKQEAQPKGKQESQPKGKESGKKGEE